MKIDSLDHLVLTVADPESSIAFYTRVLGMEAVSFGEGRRALAFGRQKINLHPACAPLRPHAYAPRAGSADICLLTSTPLEAVIEHLRGCEIDIEEGPVQRTGATGALNSVYFRDPDGNLIEVSNAIPAPPGPAIVAGGSAPPGQESAGLPPSFRNPFLNLLGVEDRGVGPGWARVFLDLRPELTNMHGKVHGGVLMTLLDTTMARAAMARQDFRLSVVSIGVTAHFLRPASGCLVTEARVTGGGRSTCFCEAEVLDADGQVVAKGVGTFKYRDPPQGMAARAESIE